MREWTDLSMIPWCGGKKATRRAATNRMNQLRRARNEAGQATPYRHWTDRETGNRLVQAKVAEGPTASSASVQPASRAAWEEQDEQAAEIKA